MGTAVSPRKQPRQERAQATVNAILDATARVLVEEGYERATTNRIAAVAGVSVGSLYQYFPNKDALLAALSDRHEEAMLELLARMAVELENAKLEDAVHAYVRAMLAVHNVDPKLHQALTQALDIKRALALQARAEAIVRAYLESHRPRLRKGLSLDLAAFILVTSVEAVTHIAVLERPKVLKQDDFAHEVTQLIVRYLVA